MSEENVELSRRVFETLNRGDIDAAIENFEPDVEWVPPASMPERRTHHGREEARKHLMELLDPWDDFRFELEDVIDAGDRIGRGSHLRPREGKRL
jgi:ketosteroid isomerase-like protein